MRRFLWALAFICSEPAEARIEPAGPQEAEVCEVPVDAHGLELVLARTGDVYLKLDPGCLELGVSAGGVELTSVPLAGVELLGYRPARRAAPSGAVPVELPMVLIVADDLPAASRRVVAPPVLRPYGDSGDPTPPVRPADPPPSGVADLSMPAAPPDSYRVKLLGGWVLELGGRPVSSGFLARIVQTLSDGWMRLTGEEPDRPERIVLAVSPDDARRLHHLFRPGTRILVLPGRAE